MRHRVAHRKLGRVTEHRIAMLRNQATSLLRHEHITTTVPRAKELRPFVERIITVAKRGLADGATPIKTLPDGASTSGQGHTGTMQGAPGGQTVPICPTIQFAEAGASFRGVVLGQRPTEIRHRVEVARERELHLAGVVPWFAQLTAAANMRQCHNQSTVHQRQPLDL